VMSTEIGGERRGMAQKAKRACIR